MAAALAHFGYTMELKQSYLSRARKERPSLWSWMQKPRNAWVHYILAVHKGKEGHWVLIKGVKLCDTYTEGRWQFVCDGPHKGARIMEVFEVKKALVRLKHPSPHATVREDRLTKRGERQATLSSSTSDRASRAGCRRTG